MNDISQDSTKPNKRTKFIISDEDDNIRLDRWFKRNLPDISHGVLQKALRKGDVRLYGKKADSSVRITSGQEISISHVTMGHAKTYAEQKKKNSKLFDDEKYKPKPLTDKIIAKTQDMVLHKSDDCIVINKPSGLAVQGGSKITDSIDYRLNALCFGGARPKLTHRLDKDTSGVLLLARSAKSAAKYTKLFFEREITKIYYALVVGVPEIKEGTIDLRIDKVGGAGNEKMMVQKSGKRSITHYRVIDTVGEGFAWVELMPVTGRTHQLRVHMAEIGHPIVADGKYGGAAAHPTGIKLDTTLHLHAKRIVIPNEIDISAPLPPHMKNSFSLLGVDENNSGISLIDKQV